MSAGDVPTRPPTALDERAAEAERSVTALFAGPLGPVPLTHLVNYFDAPAELIGGGTPEIQLTVIASMILGLPRK